MQGPLKDKDWFNELNTLFKEDEKESNVPQRKGRVEFIEPAVRHLNNQTQVGFSKKEGKKFLMQVPMYFSTFSIR